MNTAWTCKLSHRAKEEHGPRKEVPDLIAAALLVNLQSVSRDDSDTGNRHRNG